MSILYILIPAAVLLGGFFLTAFIWAARKGQFEDLVTPAHRMLIDDDKKVRGERSFTSSRNNGGTHV